MDQDIDPGIVQVDQEIKDLASDDLPAIPLKVEKFVHCLLNGLAPAEAYRQSHDTRALTDSQVWTRANYLKKTEPVRAWLQMAKEAGVAKAVYTYENYIDDLQNAAELCKDEKQLGAMISAIKELGIASGHRVEKREVTERRVSGSLKEQLAQLMNEARDMKLIEGGELVVEDDGTDVPSDEGGE